MDKKPTPELPVSDKMKVDYVEHLGDRETGGQANKPNPDMPINSPVKQIPKKGPSRK